MVDRYDAGYIRVSSRKQRDEGDSPANQEARLRAAGATVIFRDLAVSGYRLEARRNATDFQRLLAAIQGREIRRLLVTRLDRAARRDSIVLDLAERCEAAGTEFVSLGSGTVDATTTSGWLSVKLQCLMGEHYSRQLSESIRDGLRASLSRGVAPRAASSLPVHLAREPGTRHGVIPGPAWNDCRYAIERLLAQEWRLGDAGEFIAVRHGRLKHSASVGRWIRSRTLAGDATDRSGRVLVAGCWPAIATHSEQDRLVAIAEASRSRWGNVSRMAPRPLSGLCLCSACGGRLVYQAMRQYLYLRCSGTVCANRGRHMPADLAETLLMERLQLEDIVKIRAAEMGATAPDATAWQRELRFRERTPEEFLLPAERDRIIELRALVSTAATASSDSEELALMALALSDVTLRGWKGQPAPERNRLLRALIKSATLDTRKRAVLSVRLFQ